MHASPKKGSGYDSACAAAGQLGLMSLYETLFSTRQVATSQVLVTGYDFTCADRREHIQYCVNSLLKLVSGSALVGLREGVMDG